MIPHDFILKEESHKKILNLIRVHKEISGAELARLSGLQPSSLVYILRNLDHRKLIIIGGTGESTKKGGKKPILWKINDKKGILIGIEALQNRFRISIADFSGMPVEQYMEKSKNHKGNNNFVKELMKMLRKIFSKFDSTNIIGLGIAIPGLVDSREGRIIYSSVLRLKNLDLKKILEDNTRHHIEIANDANAGAKGIKWFSGVHASLPENIVYLTYNESAKNVGAGLIIQNTLYEGTTGKAGEILSPLPKINTLLKKAGQKMGEGNDIFSKIGQGPESDISILLRYYDEGCEISRYILEEISRYLASEITRLVVLLNPDLIVIGGDIARNGNVLDEMIKPQVQSVLRSKMKSKFEIPEIRYSHFGDFSVSMGAVSLMYSKIM